MKVFSLIRNLVLGVLFCAPVAADIFNNLSSDDFKTREQAQAELELWARERKFDAIPSLLLQYKKLSSPEAKSRVEAVLKELVLLQRFGSGPGFVGIRMQDGKIQVNGQLVPAVGVIEIVKESAAETAGLKVGDQIISVDQVHFGDDNLGRVAPSLVFSNYVRTKSANDVINIKLVRNGEMKNINVTLMAMPERVRLQQRDMNLPDAGTSETEKERYFQRWLLNELQKEQAKEQ